MRRTLVVALFTCLAVTGCANSSTGNSAGVPSPSTQPVEPSPSPLVAHPAPASFPVGEYARTLHLQGDLDGRWRFFLRADGRYDFISPENVHFPGTYDVAPGRMIVHDARCGDGTYTLEITAKSLRFAEVAPDACDEERHALLAGWEWLKVT